MSNNKQNMKLYTEEQMRDAIKMARNGARSEDNIIGSLNFIKPPIELPSDEEIEEALSYRIVEQISFRKGANWMRNKIQGGNNEK